MADGDRPSGTAGERHSRKLEGGDREILVAGVAVDPFAQIEDQILALHLLEPADVAEPHRNQGGFMAGPPQLRLDLVDVGEHRGDILLIPVVAATVVQDSELHAAARLRLSSAWPLIRRQAISATV